MYEANARVRDPVYGCVGAISYLQNQVSELQMQLALAQAEIFCMQMQQDPMTIPIPPLDEDEGSFLVENNLPQYLNFTSSSTNVTRESPGKSPSFGMTSFLNQ